jgi:hypothetical protein
VLSEAILYTSLAGPCCATQPDPPVYAAPRGTEIEPFGSQVGILVKPLDVDVMPAERVAQVVAQGRLPCAQHTGDEQDLHRLQPHPPRRVLPEQRPRPDVAPQDRHRLVAGLLRDHALGHVGRGRAGRQAGRAYTHERR